MLESFQSKNQLLHEPIQEVKEEHRKRAQEKLHRPATAAYVDAHDFHPRPGDIEGHPAATHRLHTGDLIQLLPRGTFPGHTY